ncbi:ABC transporter permease [bacterium]|nr:ABC transporter permease [bacterium]
MIARPSAFAIGAVGFAVAEYLWLGPAMQVGLRWWTIYSFLFCTNLFWLYNLIFHISRHSRWVVRGYVVWYVALFLFFVAIATGDSLERWRFGGEHRLLLHGLFLLISSAVFHVPVAFGLIVVAMIAYFVFPFFAEPTLLLLGIFYLVGLAAVRESRRHRSLLVVVSFALGFVLLLLVLFPLMNLMLFRSPQDVDTLLRGSGPDAGGTRDAIVMSLKTATITTGVLVLLGVPLAYFLVRCDFPGRRVLDALVDLPIVVPPPVVGLALVALVGEKQALGLYLRQQWGIELASAWGGIVLAQVFVSSPFLIRSAMAAFRAVDPRLENVSRTLGAGPARTFLRVTLPLSARGIFIGCILAWGRAIGEFGAVTFIAEHPETMPVRIYKQFVGSGQDGPAIGVAILMIFLCVVVFAGLHLLASRTVWANVRTVWSRFSDSER